MSSTRPPDPHPRPPLIVVAGGPRVDLHALGEACALGGPVIAADGGALHVLSAGHMPDFVIGDLDSVGDALGRLAPTTRVEQHPRDKDAIDLELALDKAIDLLDENAALGRPPGTDAKDSDAEDVGAENHEAPARSDGHRSREVQVFAAFGGRLDQSVANLLLASLPRFRGLRICYHDDGQRAWPLLGPASIEIEGSLGDRVSILSLAGAIRVRETAGLRWPLRDEALELGSSRGVSNELTRPLARIEIAEGLALIVHLAGA